MLIYACLCHVNQFPCAGFKKCVPKLLSFECTWKYVCNRLIEYLLISFQFIRKRSKWAISSRRPGLFAYKAPTNDTERVSPFPSEFIAS